MKIVSVDLELCQPSNSIIQIGSVHYDLKRKQKIDVFNEIANPGELPSEEITNLTGITKEAVAAARPLNEVLTSFWDWVKGRQVTNKSLITWGAGDVWLLREQ